MNKMISVIVMASLMTGCATVEPQTQPEVDMANVTIVEPDPDEVAKEMISRHEICHARATYRVVDSSRVVAREKCTGYGEYRRCRTEYTAPSRWQTDWNVYNNCMNRE